jgi:hypothetical protein
MEAVMIGLFAKEYLKDNAMVDEYELRNYIAARPEVAKLLPIQEIRDALDFAYVNGSLDLVRADEVRSVYKLHTVIKKI